MFRRRAIAPHRTHWRPVTELFKTLPSNSLKILVMTSKHLFCYFSILTVCAQTIPRPEGQAAELKERSFRAGKWQGSGWRMQGPGTRVEFTQTENVNYKLGGLVLQVEGEGKIATGESKFQALALISYDLARKEFLFRSFENQGRYLEEKATVREGLLEWGMEIGTRKIRYQIRLNEKGQWHEIGESAAPNGVWQKFFEMTLTKVD